MASQLAPTFMFHASSSDSIKTFLGSMLRSMRLMENLKIHTASGHAAVRSYKYIKRALRFTKIGCMHEPEAL